MSIFKNLIAPFQKVLIAKRMCPGCTTLLEKGKRYPFNLTSEIIICSCKRMFIYDKKSDSYRRATFKEAEEFSSKSINEVQ